MRLDGRPPGHQQAAIGPLTFEVFREGGVIDRIVVRAQGSGESIEFRSYEERIEPLHHAISRVMENLYASAQWPQKIEDMIASTGKTDLEAERIRRVIDWASRHGRQIRAAAYRLMPGINPFKKLP